MNASVRASPGTARRAGWPPPGWARTRAFAPPGRGARDSWSRPGACAWRWLPGRRYRPQPWCSASRVNQVHRGYSLRSVRGVSSCLLISARSLVWIGRYPALRWTRGLSASFPQAKSSKERVGIGTQASPRRERLQLLGVPAPEDYITGFGPQPNAPRSLDTAAAISFALAASALGSLRSAPPCVS